GESGTGKELIARAIHRLSGRTTGPFVSENCGACPEGLLESEFFGVERGAFSGADRARPGLLEMAGGGTLFLDEIGEMTLLLQKKILRALQERTVRRLGAKETIAIDFRLVSATNRTLADMVAAGTFREDLLYRLNLVTIRIPPLRERRDDIAPLVEHILAEYARNERTPAPAIGERAMRILLRYDWPGNVRELRNEICRAAVIGGRRIEPSSLSPGVRDHVNRGNAVRRAMVQGVKSLADIERELIGTVIQDAIARCGGNKTLAARLLGIPKTTLYHRMFRYGLGGMLDGAGAQEAGAASAGACP
ncbi:MAG: sigma 54-interacting transcriptional regulator, partial [Planctomycetes bacterium]|nr:sigma 54-interacting transcriptional regulator [Planctomycetota bacterium]